MNLFEYKQGDFSSELIDIVYEDDAIRVERIVSMGHTTPEDFVYDQDENELVSVLEGEAELLLYDIGERIFLRKGDSFMLLSGVRHKVIYTSEPCIWMCIFEKRGGL